MDDLDAVLRTVPAVRRDSHGWWVCEWCHATAWAGSVSFEHKPDCGYLALRGRIEALVDAAVAADRERWTPLLAFWDRLYRKMGSLDSDDVIDAAEAGGLIRIEPHPQPCEREGCPCDGEWTELYVETEAVAALRRVREQLPKYRREATP